MTSLDLRRALVTAALLALPSAIVAQEANTSKPTKNAKDSTAASRTLNAVTVTATRQKTDVHNVPTPVSVIDSMTLRDRMPNSPADILLDLPGVDLIGTGPNQARPSIRGQRGQRILLLEDGMRMNNARRQQDFGELPSLVDVSQIERVELVRGPASVLYGTDAIGGVINLITKVPSFGADTRSWGRLGYTYGSDGSLGKAEAVVGAHSGAWALEIRGNARVAGDYEAPKGTYGDVTLKNNTPLLNSGVHDHNAVAYLGWKGSAGRGAFVKVEQYVADKAGFGYVDPALLGGDPTKIEILYPHQDYQKLTMGFNSGALSNPFADKIDVTGYYSKNGRDLAQNIFIPAGPGMSIGINTWNRTDLGTIGGRAEATKVTTHAIFTYGADFFRDRSTNNDSSLTTMIGFGPTMVIPSTTPSVPNATLSSVGAFVQSDIRLHERVNVILGGRYQDVSSTPTATAGRTDVFASHDNQTFVYAANGIVRATDNVSFIASVGRGFRSPNLVERYFNGPTPEGSAYESATPDLKSETSLNLDLGIKFRTERVNAEGFVFNNDITNAITIAPTGNKVEGLPEYVNVNLGHLQTRGVEFDASVLLGAGLYTNGNWSSIKSTNVLDPKSPIGDTFSSKTNVALGWATASQRCWIEYAVRHNGEQKDITVGSSPVGNTLPAFTVQSLRGGIRGWMVGSMRQDLTVAVNNLGNVLYAEAANAGFFRPSPGRSITLAVSTAF